MIIVLHPDATDHNDFISTWGVSSGHALMQFYNNKFAPHVLRSHSKLHMLEITYLLNKQVYLHRLSVNQILMRRSMLTGFILVIVSLAEQQVDDSDDFSLGARLASYSNAYFDGELLKF